MTTAQAVEARLTDGLGIPFTVEDDSGSLVVTGMVSTEDVHRQAIEVLRDIAEGRRVIDNITVTDALPESVEGFEISEEEAGSLPGATAGLEDEDESLEAGDFTDQKSLNSPDEAAGPSTSLYEDVVSEGGRVYTPPIDPVGTNREVIGGLQSSSLDSVEVDRSALDGRPGDEALRDAILRELREDAATTMLEIEVDVSGGVARLRGHVPWLEDAENAEEVAARVPGLVEVIDDTAVDQFERRQS